MLDTAVAGFTAGVVGTLIGYPLDTVKVFQQSQAVRLGPRPSMLALARSIYVARGVSGFYQGVAVPLCGITALNTLNFSMYARFRSALGLAPRQGSFDGRVLVAGALVGPCACVISTPMDMIKIQMQLNAYPSTLHAARAIVRGAGALGLFIGFRVNLLRESAFGAGYFGAYELARESALDGLPVAVVVPLAGAVGGVVAWMLSLPFDTIKSVQQSASVAEHGHPASRPTAIAARIWKAQGAGGFYRGGGASILRAVLVSGTRFSAYEAALEAMRSS